MGIFIVSFEGVAASQISSGLVKTLNKPSLIGTLVCTLKPPEIARQWLEKPLRVEGLKRSAACVDSRAVNSCIVKIEPHGIHVNGVHVDQMWAYPLRVVALMLGVSYETCRREVLRGKLHRTESLGLVAAEELKRYLREESKPRKRQRFPHKSDSGGKPQRNGVTPRKPHRKIGTQTYFPGSERWFHPDYSEAVN